MNPYHHNHFTVDEVTLRRQEIRAQIEIDCRILAQIENTARITVVVNHANGNLVRQIQQFIYGKDHPDKHIIRFPSTWWDAVKERFAPSWFLDRYPVRFTTYKATLSELYPDLTPALPDREYPPVMKFHVHKQNDYPIW
jgi:hypothetical protein